MVKKFNEDWDTFQDFMDANEAPSDPRDHGYGSVNSDFDEKSFEVIGLPSGQVIYMSDKQIKFFKGREKIRYIKVWRKPTPNGGYTIKSIKKYCFEDKDYDDIKELIEEIIW